MGIATRGQWLNSDPGCGLIQSAEAFAWQEAPGKYQRHLLQSMHTIPTGPPHVESGPSSFK